MQSNMYTNYEHDDYCRSMQVGQYLRALFGEVGRALFEQKFVRYGLKLAPERQPSDPQLQHAIYHLLGVVYV